MKNVIVLTILTIATLMKAQAQVQRVAPKNCAQVIRQAQEQLAWVEQFNKYSELVEDQISKLATSYELESYIELTDGVDLLVVNEKYRSTSTSLWIHLRAQPGVVKQIASDRIISQPTIRVIEEDQDLVLLEVESPFRPRYRYLYFSVNSGGEVEDLSSSDESVQKNY